MLDFTWFDLLIVVVFVLSTAIGIYRGILRESYTIVVWSIAFIIAMVHGRAAGEIFTFVDSAAIKKVLGMLFLFIAVLIAGLLVKFFAFKSLNVGKPNGLDRFGGSIFGILRAYVIVALIFVFVAPSKFAEQEAYKDSQLGPYFQDIVDFLAIKMPPKWQNKKLKDSSVIIEQEIPVESNTNSN
jgi:membrane protein required for colicin V production